MTYDEAADFDEKRKCVADLNEMIDLAGIEGVSEWRSLEVGGEGGLLAGLIADQVRSVISTDIVSAISSYEGTFVSGLQSKFERHGETLPLDKMDFLAADAQELPFRDHWFDFYFALNAFEHIPDPERALREAFRVTRPGGYIFLMFDPVWTADSGSHFLHRLQEPWLHLIADDEAAEAQMRANGASSEEVHSYRHHMNRLPITYYREMFPRVIEEANARVIFHHSWGGCVDPSYAGHPNRTAAAERLNLDPDDLLVRGIRYLIQV